jgi:hypothetical protein
MEVCKRWVSNDDWMTDDLEAVADEEGQQRIFGSSLVNDVSPALNLIMGNTAL